MNDAITEIDAWLEAKGVSLWADFMIVDDTSRREGAIWFKEQLDSYHKFQRTYRTTPHIEHGAWDVVV
jgi:hypothetical protein